MKLGSFSFKSFLCFLEKKTFLQFSEVSQAISVTKFRFFCINFSIFVLRVSLVPNRCTYIRSCDVPFTFLFFYTYRNRTYEDAELRKLIPNGSSNRRYPALPVERLENEFNRKHADDDKMFREEFAVRCSYRNNYNEYISREALWRPFGISLSLGSVQDAFIKI